jgi:membrane protein DedA with SNARE-associated domain/rhodanese-related sulfurtransferase
VDALLHIIETYGLLVVFVCVLLDQGGLPFPAWPAIIVTSATAIDAQTPLWPILLVATLAALIADLLWYAGGRQFGARLLRLMCKVSLSPDSCVGLTRRIYAKWGAPSLILAKFIPGFAAVATVLAGETRTSLRRFVIYDGIGALLWSAGAVVLGVVFHRAVEALLDELELLGHYALWLLLAAIALFVLYKWWQRHRFLQEIRMSRITCGELREALASRREIAILDVRSEASRNESGWIPRSVYVRDVAELELDRGTLIVTYCDCPNDASAAVAANKLKARGYKEVRPLEGGIEAWRALGMPIDGAAVAPPADATLQRAATGP